MSRTTIKIKDRVRGTYCSLYRFSGTVEAMRRLEVPTDGAISYAVRLDAPIDIFGGMREHLEVVCLCDGSPSSYTQKMDQMKTEAA